MSDPIDVLAAYVAWQYANTPEKYRDKEEAFDALKELRRRERAQALRPLRWYTDARDGLCPDAQ